MIHTYQVVILADPDGQEICYVGGEAFQELSQVIPPHPTSPHLTPPQLNLSHTTSPGQVDPKAVELLEAALEEDRSVEWFARKGRSKVEEA